MAASTFGLCSFTYGINTPMPTKFYGWFIVAAAVCTFGLSTGLPYYNMPVFYDYYAKEFNWSKPDITLGFPLAALFTLWVGPFLVHRFKPKMLAADRVVAHGNGLSGLQHDAGDLNVYYAFWFLYTVGYIFSRAPFRIRFSFPSGSRRTAASPWASPTSESVWLDRSAPIS